MISNILLIWDSETLRTNSRPAVNTCTWECYSLHNCSNEIVWINSRCSMNDRMLGGCIIKVWTLQIRKNM